MILSKQFLDSFTSRRTVMESLECIQESDSYDVFISYSYNDKFFVKKIVSLLEECGYSVYIDYDDLRLDRKSVNEKTARRLVEKMKKCKGLLYIFSPNSKKSKWCPWEVGVFSGIKDFKCANLPLVEQNGDEFKNQEYLELYPYVDYAKSTKGYNEFWICESDSKYISLRKWLQGHVVCEHI